MQHGYTARYVRLPRLLHEIQLAKADGSYLKMMAAIARVDVLVMDDWGLAPLTGEQRRDVLEVVEDRYGTRSLLMASQLPVDQWFDVIGDATIADAIMDRIVHGAHRIELGGGSGRKRKATKTAAQYGAGGGRRKSRATRQRRGTRASLALRLAGVAPVMAGMVPRLAAGTVPAMAPERTPAFGGIRTLSRILV